MDSDNYNKNIENLHENPKFQVKGNQLYRIKGEKLLKVINKYEVGGLLYMMHDHELSAHFGIRATQDKIREKYWWKDLTKRYVNL